MFLIRDTFHLKFGMFKETIATLQHANQQGLFKGLNITVLSDFTGDAYRLIMEIEMPTLADYEQMMSEGMKDPKWQEFYNQFKSFVLSSHREILRKHSI